MKKLSWWAIVAILIGVALVSGLLFGLLGELIGLTSSMKGGGIGAAVGITAAFLVSRRLAADKLDKNL